MRVIAVTGGIGSGKSTVAALYRAQGVPVLDADTISRALTAPGGEALPAIREAFGPAVFQADGSLDRAALARLVFGADPAPLAKLNAILHPLIRLRMLAALDACRKADAPAVLLDVPLLFETGMDQLADAVVCVTAPLAVRLRRLRRRDGLSREAALSRIRRQNTAEATERLSDYVLSTHTTRWLLRRRALALWRRILTDGPRRASALPPAP